MKLQLAKWGNSLVVKLPEEYALAAGLKEGDCAEVEITPTGGITLTPVQPFDEAAFLERMRNLRARMQKTTSKVEQMRQEDRY